MDAVREATRFHPREGEDTSRGNIDLLQSSHVMDQTAENIRILSIFHYVLGGLTYFLALLPIFHFLMGIFFLVIDPNEFETSQPAATEEVVSEGAGTREGERRTDLPPAANELDPEIMFRFIGGAFTFIAGFLILAGFVLATLMIVAGRRLAQHRSHTFCIVVAGMQCLLFPFHAILGIFTLILLLRPEGRALFGVDLPQNPVPTSVDGGS